MTHAYPQDLADVVRGAWISSGTLTSRLGEIAIEERDDLPEDHFLAALLSTCYQATLLREEKRELRFRIILRNPQEFDASLGPPRGLHRILFTNPRPFSEYEIRKLSPAADFESSLLGVCVNPEQGLVIWGLVHSGRRWMQTIHGGRDQFEFLPPSLVLCATGPGRLTACCGSITLAKLSGGRINVPSQEVFEANWLNDAVRPVRDELRKLHLEAREEASVPWAKLEPDVTRILTQQVIRRVISVLRDNGHGGTLLLVPQNLAELFLYENPYIALKYRFVEEEPRQRFRTLIVNIMNSLAQIYGDRGPNDTRMIGWPDYVACKDETLAELDEGIFELGNLLAGLAAVDGAVVLNLNFDIIGFGGEISGSLQNVHMVARSFDAEATRLELEPAEAVGTRHRSAYRLCNTLKEVIAIVVSQDSRARIIKSHLGVVTYWDQIRTSILDI